MSDDLLSADSGCLYLFLFLGLMLYIFFPWTMWYSINYSVPTEHVFIDKQPKDCDFDHAPLGSKGCKYKKRVEAMRDNKGVVSDVYVMWDKVADD